ncbi:hypothetical protein FQN60_012544, partial [Etheostoma spectabile]
MEGGVRRLILKNCQLDQAGEVSYQALNAITSAMLNVKERDIKVVRPLYSVEVTETETAKFETEISEEDLHATWKLKGEMIHPSAVRSNERG